MKKATLRFHRSLRKFTNNTAEITIDANSYYDLVKGVVELFPNLEKYFKKVFTYKYKEELVLVVNKKVLEIEELILPVKGIVNLVPLVYGSGRITTIIIVVAIIALVVINPGNAFIAAGAIQAGTGAVAVGTAGLTILGKLAVGVATSLLLTAIAPKPKNPKQQEAKDTDAGARRDNDSFGSLQNTIASGTPIPLIYGMFRVSGQFVSGYTKSINHGKTDTINVGEQF